MSVKTDTATSLPQDGRRPVAVSEPTVLIVPGLHGSGPDHWQSHWEARHPGFRRVEQMSWSRPRLGDWVDTLEEAVRSHGRLAPLPFPAWVIASSDDPNATITRARSFAQAWRARFIDAGRCGHINVASGHWHWPEGEALLARIREEST